VSAAGWPLTDDAAPNSIFGQAQASNSAPNTVRIWTKDDTEARLLAELPAQVAFLIANGSWTLGCEFGTSAAPGQTAVGLIGALRHLDWKSADQTASFRHSPALTPQLSTPLPQWMLTAFNSWKRNASIHSAVEATALEAGLRQIHGDLDGSHQCAQSIEGEGQRNGDYWHAIMHRREPDYGNSQYWFRRVGQHPVFEPLAKEASLVAERFPNATFNSWLPRLVVNGAWNPMAFVDCVAAAAKHTDATFCRVVEEVQYREMLLLFAQTYRDAVGGST